MRALRLALAALLCWSSIASAQVAVPLGPNGGAAGGGAPSGAAGGSLGGTYPNPTVTTNANLTGDVTSVGNATSYNNVVPVAKGGVPSGSTTYTPTVAGLTVVNGTGSVSTTGKYTQVANIIYWEITIIPSGTATTASTLGTTTISVPTLPANSSSGTAQPVSISAATFGSGLVLAGNGFFYAPTWSASNLSIVITGWYFTT